MNISNKAYELKPFSIEGFEKEYLFGIDQNNAEHTTRSRSSAGRTPHKRIRVKSRKRFITFLVIMIGLIVGGFGFITGMNESTATVTDDYISYEVMAGDTIWDIANEVNQSGMDTRKVVYAICHINNIQPEAIQPGMVLTVPVDL